MRLATARELATKRVTRAAVARSQRRNQAIRPRAAVREPRGKRSRSAPKSHAYRMGVWQ